MTRRSRLKVSISVAVSLGLAVPLIIGNLPSAGAGAERFSGTQVSEPAAAPAESAYPYATASRVGPWGFHTRHSTDYIAWRLYERDVTFYSSMRGPNGKAGEFGNAGDWATNALKIGLRVDNAPRPGSIAQWRAGEEGAGDTGHVAFVEQVHADGSVRLSEFDWNVEYGYSERGQVGTTPVRAPRYIHVNAT